MPDGVGDIEPNDDGFTAKLLRPLSRSSRVTIWISRTLGRAPTRKCDRTARDNRTIAAPPDRGASSTG
jgi:hypothetical protein